MILVVLGGILALGVGVVVYAIKRLLYICQPNEVLIFSGGRVPRAGGGRVGYRIIKGGRAVRIPIMEKVDRMDLTNMSIDVAVSGAYSRGGFR